MYQNFRAFILFILTYWYWKSVYPFKSCDGFFKDLRNWRFCRKFWVNRLFCSAKKILSNFFVRATKYTKISGPLSFWFWYWYIENLLIRLKAVMVSLKILIIKWENQFFSNIKELCGEKSLWQSFKIQKSEMIVSKDFSLALSWCTQFFPTTVITSTTRSNEAACVWT